MERKGLGPNVKELVAASAIAVLMAFMDISGHFSFHHTPGMHFSWRIRNIYFA